MGCEFVGCASRRGQHFAWNWLHVQRRLGQHAAAVDLGVGINKSGGSGRDQ